VSDEGPVDFGDKLSDFLMGDEHQPIPASVASASYGKEPATPAPRPIRVLRFIEYTYADADTMIRDMSRWTLQHDSPNGKIKFQSTNLPPTLEQQ